MPEVRKMTTRRSARNLHQLKSQAQSEHSGAGGEESVRDELNCNRAMKKKTKACSREFFATGVEKGGGIMSSASLRLCMSYIGIDKWHIFS